MLPKCDLSARALFFSISLTQHCHISICRCCRVASLSVEIDMCYFYLANVSHNFDNTSNCLPKLTFNELIWLALKLLFCRITYSIHPIYMQLSLLLLLIVLDLLYISKVLASQRASACLFKCFFFTYCWFYVACVVRIRLTIVLFLSCLLFILFVGLIHCFSLFIRL